MMLESFLVEKAAASPEKLLGLAKDMKGLGSDVSSLDKPIELNKRMLPENGGTWSGDKGDSDWNPDDNLTPGKHNSENLIWKELKEKYGFEKITFSDGEPDFTEVSEATVEVEDFSTDRNANFSQADEACAKKWSQENKDGKSWTPDEVREYRKSNGLSWHERSDMKTVDLVPSVVHGNIPHSGGISAAKKEAQGKI